MPDPEGRRPARKRLTRTAGRIEPIRIWQLAAGVLAGNLLLHQLPALPELPLLLTAIPLIVGLRRHILPVALLVSFCWTAMVAHSALDTRWPASRDGDDIDITGWVDSIPSADNERTLFSLRVVIADTDIGLRRLRLSWYEPAPRLQAGQTIVATVRLRTPHGLANPGGFDYERWLFQEGFDATGYVRAGRVDSPLHAGPGPWWAAQRERLVSRLGELIADPSAGALVSALALGERDNFEDHHWDMLRRTGTSHLVAVSGLHIGIIAALAWLLTLRSVLLAPLGLARRAHLLAGLASIVVALIYSALAGFSLPTRRAMLMLVVIQCLLISKRRWSTGSGLGLALIAILVIDPLASLGASFWLSFGAVTLLIAVSASSGPAPAARQPVAGRLATFLRLQIWLTLGLMPLVVWYFGQISVVSVAVNLIAIPLFSLIIVPLCLMVAATALVRLPVPGLAEIAENAAILVWTTLDAAAGLPLASFDIPVPPPLHALIAIAAVAMAVAGRELPGWRLAWIGLLPLLDPPTSRSLPGFATFEVLDVGHGLAVAIETANHRALYDAGPVARSGFNAGNEIVVPALAQLAREPLDLMILSHGDSDHAGGAGAVAARYPSVRVLASPDVDWPGKQTCMAGQFWVWDQVRFSVLHPRSGSGLEGNDSSCVVLIETLGGRLLLTGDIERRAELLLLGDERVSADVVVVPHHGSLTSSTAGFTHAVSPRFAIVSAGFNNRWDFPRPEVRRRWLEAGATMLVTGNDGAVSVRFRDTGIEVESHRQRRQRYWQAVPAPVSGAMDGSAL
jgi:competence protein ComEC